MEVRSPAHIDHLTADLQTLQTGLRDARQRLHATQRELFHSRAELLAVYTAYATATAAYPGEAARLRQIREEGMLEAPCIAESLTHCQGPAVSCAGAPIAVRSTTMDKDLCRDPLTPQEQAPGDAKRADLARLRAEAEALAEDLEALSEDTLTRLLQDSRDDAQDTDAPW